ncbi:MAG: hypothetical protein U0Q22_11255 [Acidimicrobiales bacterium]
MSLIRSTATAAVVAVATLLVASACSNDRATDAKVLGTSVSRTADQAASSQPTEYVGMSARIPLDPARPEAVLDRVFGKSADADGSAVIDLGVGLRLRSEPHPATSAERVLTFEMDTSAEPAKRVLAVAPVSKANGAVFIEAARAALAKDAEVEATQSTRPEPVRLEYRTKSSKGGSITLSVIDDVGVPPVLEVAANSPVTSLTNGHMNQPATDDAAVESIYGLVWFHVSRDKFDFFVHRAYGLSAGKAQNFSDFELVPHTWLRLTVTPLLDKGRVDVGFEVVTLDGKRVPVAKAPASLVAGEQFMNTVFRGFDTMAAQEAAAPGSSTPWEAPFYYDDPNGGGVVEVIAQGEKGEAKIAYSIESPKTKLHDVDFVPYQGKVVVPKDWNAPDPTCAKLGTKKAAAGRFDVAFTASSTVRSTPLKAPLTGPIYGSVYRSADVKITGPLPGTTPVARFSFPDVDSTQGPSKPFLIDTQLDAGSYQILGFMDIDRNADPAAPKPDAGDPVFIPIGGFELACERQPVTAEFALTLPADQVR